MTTPELTTLKLSIEKFYTRPIMSVARGQISEPADSLHIQLASENMAIVDTHVDTAAEAAMHVAAAVYHIATEYLTRPSDDSKQHSLDDILRALMDLAGKIDPIYNAEIS